MGGGMGAVNPSLARLSPNWTERNELPEEGLEPTRTYAQALLRRPRLPFRHSGATSQTLVWHFAPLAWGDAPASISEYVRWELISNVCV
jgi:hypothetical protein